MTDSAVRLLCDHKVFRLYPEISSLKRGLKILKIIIKNKNFEFYQEKPLIYRWPASDFIGPHATGKDLDSYRTVARTRDSHEMNSSAGSRNFPANAPSPSTVAQMINSDK